MMRRAADGSRLLAEAAHAVAAAAAAAAAPSWFVALHRAAAPWLSVAVFGAPLPTLRRVARDRSVGTLPLLPYTSMVASAFLWATYGLLRREPAIYGSNLAGAALGAYYTRTFLRFAPPASPTLPGAVRTHLAALAGLAAGTLLLVAAAPRDVSARWVGRAAVLCCLALFAAPLAALRTVLAARSAASIPLPFTLAATANCWAWTVVGLWDMHDPNVYLTNGLALLFGLAQVALKLAFWDDGGGGGGGVRRPGSGMQLPLMDPHDED